MLARSQNSVKASHRECGLMMEELCASRPGCYTLDATVGGMQS